jgi:hypothetical protein
VSPASIPSPVEHSERIVEKLSRLKPRLISLDDAANYLGLAPKTLRNKLSRAAGAPFPVKPKRIGRRVLFDLRELDAFVDKLGE